MDYRYQMFHPYRGNARFRGRGRGWPRPPFSPGHPPPDGAYPRHPLNIPLNPSLPQPAPHHLPTPFSLSLPPPFLPHLAPALAVGPLDHLGMYPAHPRLQSVVVRPSHTSSAGHRSQAHPYLPSPATSSRNSNHRSNEDKRIRFSLIHKKDNSLPGANQTKISTETEIVAYFENGFGKVKSLWITRDMSEAEITFERCESVKMVLESDRHLLGDFEFVPSHSSNAINQTKPSYNGGRHHEAGRRPPVAIESGPRPALGSRSVSHPQPGHSGQGSNRQTNSYKTLLVRFMGPAHSVDQLQQLFSEFGSLEGVAVNKNKTLCWVYFKDRASAEKAFAQKGQFRGLRLEPRPFTDAEEALYSCTSLDHELILEKVNAAQTVEEQVEVLKSCVLLDSPNMIQRHEVVSIISDALSEKGIRNDIKFLGSSINGIGFKDADIDLFIELPEVNNVKKKLGREQALSLLCEIHGILKSALKMHIMEPISATCPIIKVDFKVKGIRSPLNIDISLSNALGHYNSRLIHFLGDIEPRFKDLAVILRYWAKRRGFLGSYKMSSYSFSLLVVFFCQNTTPKVLPSVEFLRQYVCEERIVEEKWDSSYCEDPTLIPRSKNKSTVQELLAQFFNYYCNFSFCTHFLCPLKGKAISKKEFLVSGEVQMQAMTDFICIRDPFDLSHNVTGKIDHDLHLKLMSYIYSVAMSLQFMFNKSTTVKTWGIGHLLSQEHDDQYIAHSLERDAFYLSPDRTFLNVDVLPKVSNQLNSTPEEIIKGWANAFINFTVELVREGLQLKCLIHGKWDILWGEMNPIAELECQVRDQYYAVWVQRKKIWGNLTPLEKQLQVLEREKLITKKILDETNQVTCAALFLKFVIVLNAKPFLPFIDIVFTEVTGKSAHGDQFKLFLKPFIMERFKEFLYQPSD